MWLDYTNSYSNNRYNGNIIHMVWSRGDAINKRYYFSYDELNRLKGASYREYSQTEEVPGTTNKYTESYSYDANGNIKGVTRCGLVNDGTIHVGYHDLLTYKYFNNDEVTGYGLWATMPQMLPAGEILPNPPMVMQPRNIIMTTMAT